MNAKRCFKSSNGAVRKKGVFLLALIWILQNTMPIQAFADLKVVQSDSWPKNNTPDQPMSYKFIHYIRSHGALQRTDSYLNDTLSSVEIFDKKRHRYTLVDCINHKKTTRKWPMASSAALNFQHDKIVTTNDHKYILGFLCRKYTDTITLEGIEGTGQDILWVAPNLPPIVGINEGVDPTARLQGMVLERSSSTRDPMARVSSLRTIFISNVALPISFYAPRIDVR